MQHIKTGVFDGLRRLELLDLMNNNLTHLESGSFRGLYHLKMLDLDGSPLTGLRENFADLWSLERLLLKSTNLTVLNATLFSGVGARLKRLNLRGTEIQTIERGTFLNLSRLEDIVYSSLATPLYPGVFDGLHSLKSMYVYDPRLCCLAPDYARCVVEIPTHPLFTCRKTFLQNSTIKTFIFILGISALLGNGIVIIMRLRSKSSSDVARVQSTLITNLAVSDFLMGVYMFVLAIMDIYIGESYFWDGRAEEWRSSTPCQILGFISVISSEVSVFILTVISVDRFLCIMFPFSSNRLRPMSCTIVVTAVWFLAFLLGATSILLNQFVPDAYSLSDVCVGLPFIRKPINPTRQVDDRAQDTYNILVYQTATTASVSTWRFSTVLFLGINLVSFCVIALAYIMIFINVRFVRTKVGKQTNQSAGEVKMAVRMFLIVGTDFFCWMPIIILGILVQTVGITVTPDIYAWLVVFVLPINSSLNPFIYTIAHVISERAKK
ncbi:G-protein coupled receptor GRL101-like isoform X2 [Diadema setosum]|uniref:G-protein coupled receptor GRL101-like isoform X2 n=1 Tax=Diadema setosum TaxID=31175 RepID=UPI003B3A4D39